MRWDKVSYSISDPSRNASSTDSTTWGSFADAVTAYQGGCSQGPRRFGRFGDRRWDGISLVHLHVHNLTGFDFDHCRDPLTGEIHPAVLNVIRRLCSYTEVTPSGTGLRVYV